MSVLTSVLGDITVHPDFHGLPPQVLTGLQHLTNNAAALLLMVAGFGIVISALGLVLGHTLHLHQVAERSKAGLALSISCGAILYAGVAMANYATGLFR